MPQTFHLREDEPHPVRDFSSATQFGKNALIKRVLRIDETLQFAKLFHMMIQRPTESEAAPYQLSYISKVTGDDPHAILESQFSAALSLFAGITEEASLHRYQPDKWSIREVLNHITDTERIFTSRMLWFARGLPSPLPGFDQDIAAAGAHADSIPWAAHVEEFRNVRLATISLYRNIPPEGWTRSGTASNIFITVPAMAYLIPGHAGHHLAILREKY